MCQLINHPEANKKGEWIDSASYKKCKELFLENTTRLKSFPTYLNAVICKCDDADRNALYRKCCLSINGTPVYVLFDTGADPAWIRYGEHDNSDSMTMGL